MTTGFRDLEDWVNIILQMEKKVQYTERQKKIFSNIDNCQIPLLSLSRPDFVYLITIFSLRCQIIFEICEILPVMTSFTFCPLSLEIVCCPSYLMLLTL